ncbi:MAG: SDR family NAD(P)-dependent oxidoreductase [Deltaproteobacteria bacterium]|jgi:UDP-glucose 4-epimerase|nr:SDR family NAD(P)-dependent oxidoreductase [Deltaproteobacteria bacterium]
MRKTGKELALVTGGAGFIGSHLVEALVRKGVRVRVLDDLSSGSLQKLHQVIDHIELMEGDVRDLSEVMEACRGASTIYHLAAMASIPMSMAQPHLCLAINGEGTLNVMEAARAQGARRLVFASSSALYGDLPGPHLEDMTLRANTPYAASKLLGENLADFYMEHKGLHAVSLRYFNVYGPRQGAEGPDSGVIPIFIKQISKGLPPVIYGDGEQTRDFIHVLDVVRATILAASRKGAKGVYNVATGAQVSINSLAELLSYLRPQAPPAVHLPARAGDPERSWGSVARAKKDLGFEAKIDLAPGLKDLLKKK